MDTRKGKDKQTNNGHKKGEGQTDKQWTQERGRTNRQTMNTSVHCLSVCPSLFLCPLFVCLSFPFLVSIVCLFVLPLSCVHCLSVFPSPFLCPLFVCLSFPFLVFIFCLFFLPFSCVHCLSFCPSPFFCLFIVLKDKQTNNEHKKGEGQTDKQ
jgi:hypothetical protein